MKSRSVLVLLAAMAWLSLIQKPSTAATPAESLESNVLLAFIETPLEDVVDYLTDLARVKIELEDGLDRKQPITARLKDVSLKTALRNVLEPRGLRFDAEAERIYISRIDPHAPPPEYGEKLKPNEALDGWIALFDGHSVFGWNGSRIGGSELVGGQSTSSFGDYMLRAYFKDGGQITLAGETMDVPRGPFSREVKGRGPIVLVAGTSVSLLAIRPLNLKPLFNGRDLGEWKRIDHAKLPEAKRPQWRVEEGALRAIGGPGCVEYPTRYGDFVLQVDVRTRAQYANGGVFVRSVPGDFMNGYEAQVYNRMIDNDPAKPFTWSTGSIDDRQLARRVVSRDHVTYRMTVVANGPHLATWVNGYQLVDWTDTRAKHDNPRQGLRTDAGTLQLQAHDPETDVEFRGVYIAPLE